MDNGIIISLCTILSAITLLMLKLCFKSKCTEISCCFGLLKVKRDVETERKIEDVEIKHNIDNNVNNVV
jgi:hypothetical protein